MCGVHPERPTTGSGIPVLIPPLLLEILLVQAQRDERPVADVHPLLADWRQLFGHVPRCRTYPLGSTATFPCLGLARTRLAVGVVLPPLSPGGPLHAPSGELHPFGCESDRISSNCSKSTALGLRMVFTCVGWQRATVAQVYTTSRSHFRQIRHILANSATIVAKKDRVWYGWMSTMPELRWAQCTDLIGR